MLTKDKAAAHRGKWTWELSQKAETGILRWATYRLYSTGRAGSLWNNGGLVCFQFFYVLKGSFELQLSFYRLLTCLVVYSYQIMKSCIWTG